MLIQVNIWCSHELATWLMNNWAGNLWIQNIQNEREKQLISDLKPYISFRNTAVGQFGSLFPKLLYFYECNEAKFLIEEPKPLGEYRKQVSQRLDAYYDDMIGYRSRSLDRDNISPYPYLDVESKDYIVTHNIEVNHDSEELLKLIRRQLGNLNKTHCFMTQIRAFEKNFDLGYQSFNLTNPKALIESPYDNETKIETCWLTNRKIGYSADEIESNFSVELPEDLHIVTREMIDQLAQEGHINYTTLSVLQQYESVEWFEPFGVEYVETTIELFCVYRGWITTVIPKKDVMFVEFDWD